MSYFFRSVTRLRVTSMEYRPTSMTPGFLSAGISNVAANTDGPLLLVLIDAVIM